MMESVDDDASNTAALLDGQQFWQQIHDSCSADIDADSSIDTPQEALIGHLDGIYSICERGYDVHLQTKQDIDALLHNIFHASFISYTSLDTLAATLTTLAIGAVSLPQLYLLYETLLRLGEQNSNIFQSCPTATQLLPRLVHHFWAARYAQEYNEKHCGAMDTVSPGKRKSKESNEGLAWNVKHVRSSSKGNVVRQQTEERDRALQIKLCDRSISLLYEICRSRRLTYSDLRSIDATFVDYLFELVESSRNWTDDSYSFRLIKLVVALNEQFMVSGISAVSSKARARKSTASAANTVLTVLRTRLNASKTFGENLIFMLNRASSRDAEDVCVQLLILKLLYLLFTTKETSHYFYTNDLKVLVDVFVRELSDLPDEHESLRHTYLRVLHPLLTNTQLLTYPYKRTEVRNLLLGLTSHGHLRDISATTQRLVERCLSAKWCVDLDQNSNGRGIANGGEGLSHSLVVQSIRGGPSKIVQTAVKLDSEGVAVPIESNGDVVQATSVSTKDTAAIVNVEEAVQDGPANTPAIRTTSDEYHSSPDGTMHTSFVSSTTAAAALSNGDVITISSPTSYEDVERNTVFRTNARPRWHSRLGSPPYLQPEHTKRVHSAIDVRRFAGTEDFDSENESESYGDATSQSWHQAMASDHQVGGTERKRTGTGSSLRTPVDLSANEDGLLLEQQETSESDNLPAPSNVANHSQLNLHESSDEVDKSTSRGAMGVLRRRPPAPPTLRDRPREAGSTILAATEDLADADTPSCRSVSPLHPNSNGGRRRRPPPPPVNRSTKSSALQQQQQHSGLHIGHQQGYADPATLEEASIPIETFAFATDEQGDKHSRLSQYMQHLHLTSERGYGW